MKSKLDINLGLLEGRSFIVGREGHIYVDSPSASKRHAEIKVIHGKIYLRDLNSTNGTFIYRKKRLILFDEGYVSPLQPVLIGDQWFTVLSLLSIAHEFAAIDDATTEINWQEKVVNRH